MNNNKKFTYRYTNNSKPQKLYTSNFSMTMGRPLPNRETLSIMVWNIFKQQRLDWLPFLREHGSKQDILLLQEAQSTPTLINYATSNFRVADQVPAIKMPNLASGVMTLSKTYPIYTRPFWKKEPFLRLPKSALITVYPLYDSRLLMVVNVHSVNFSLGVEIYQEQIKSVVNHVQLHKGPVIFAGDFNTWSRQRLLLLYKFIRHIGLRQVVFKNDYRKAVFNNPLDFIFYRDLDVKESSVIKTDASDHNPLLVTFSLK